MIKIKEISKKKQSLYQVDVLEEDKETSYTLTENTIVKYRILPNQEFLKKEFKEILKTNEYETIYLKCVSYISYQMRTISEVKKYIKKYTKKEDLIAKLIKELKEHNYLNDSNYVTQYCYEKMTYEMVGKKYIKDKLIQKGIHYDLIEDALYDYDENKEIDKICTLIDKDLKYPYKKNVQKVLQSYKQRFSTKGFALSSIEAAINIKRELISQNIDEDSLLINDIMKLRRNNQSLDYTEKQKLIEKLMRKGYLYQDIKKHLN